MVRVRYIGIRFLNLRTKRTKRTVRIGAVRFMRYLQSSMNICATVHILLEIHDIAPVARPVYMSRLYLI